MSNRPPIVSKHLASGTDLGIAHGRESRACPTLAVH